MCLCAREAERAPECLLGLDKAEQSQALVGQAPVGLPLWPCYECPPEGAGQ